MNLGGVLLAVLVGVVVKGAVVILTAILVVRLYRATFGRPPRRRWILLPEEHAPEIKVLWWSLLLFAIAELTCGIEVWVIFRTSAIFSGIHSATSGLGTGLFALGIYIFLDKKWIRFGESACLANRICRGCTIGQEGGCKFLIVLLLAATFVILAAVPAFFAPTERMLADLDRYTLPFDSLNGWYDGTVEPYLQAHFPNYGRTDAQYMDETSLIIEFRILPAAAAALGIIALVLLKSRREILGLRFAAFAFGMLCFTYLEVILYPATGTVLIAALGHEVVELWFLLFTAAFLRRAFPPEPAVREEGS